MVRSWLFLSLCYCTTQSRMLLATNTNNSYFWIFKLFVYHNSTKYDTVKKRNVFWIQKVKIERGVIALLFYKILTCVSCHHVVMTKTIISRGTIYSDIKILHVSETRIIVLKLNVQTGIPIIGQVMKVFISCNQRETCLKFREREGVGVGGCECVCANKVRTTTRDPIFYIWSFNILTLLSCGIIRL